MGFAEAAWSFSLKTVHSFLHLRDSIGYLLVWLWASILNAVKHKGTKLECIQSDVKRLKKIPMHLAFVIFEDASFEDLARLVTWSFSAGIHNVLLYDPNGELQRQLVHLRSAITAEHQKMFSPPVPAVEVCSRQDSPPHVHNSNGTSYTALVLSPEDGRQDVVSMATNICHSVLQRRLQLKSIDTTLVASQISATSGIPEPNLAVVFGNVNSMLGFPPWQTRVTEILFLPSHHKMAYQDFLAVLQQYARTEQRFGK